jgi:hypothetical protein
MMDATLTVRARGLVSIMERPGNSDALVLAMPFVVPILLLLLLLLLASLTATQRQLQLVQQPGYARVH